MLKRLKQYMICVVMTMVVCGIMNTASAIPFQSISQLIFFGDSLTDSGFNDLWPIIGIPGQPLPFGKAPTFTTYGGYTWSQYIAHDIKGFPLPVYPGPTIPDRITNNAIYPVPGFVSATLHGIDFAAAGSTTNSTGFAETWAPSLHQQVLFYLSTIPPGQSLDPNAVYFVWEGANDFLTLIFGPTIPTQLQLLQTAYQAASNIASDIALLAQHGARRVVVLSLPNFALAPFAVQLPNRAALKDISFTFNSMLNTQLGRVIHAFGTKILYVDVYTLLENVVSATAAGKPYVVAGQSFQFVNYNMPACGAVRSAIYCPPGTPTGYIFADQLHPTDMTHRVLALTVETLLLSWR